MNIKEYLIYLCYALLVCELLLILMPDGGMKRIAKFACGILIMSIVVVPITRCSYSGDKYDGYNIDVKSTYSEIIINEYNKQFSNNDK